MGRIVGNEDSLDRVAGSPRLGVLEALGADKPLADLLAGSGRHVDAFLIESTDSLSGLIERADHGAFDAVVVAPELAGSWPASIADSVIDAVAGRMPLVIVCRSAQDAAVITSRSRHHGVVVLLRERVTGAELLSVLQGELARRRAVGGDA